MAIPAASRQSRRASTKKATTKKASAKKATAKKAAAASPPAARAEDAVKIYGSGPTAVHALDGVTVEFPSGRYTAIIMYHGRNGVNDAFKDVAVRYAEEGIVGMAVNYFTQSDEPTNVESVQTIEGAIDEDRLAVFRDLVNSLDLPELPDEPGSRGGQGPSTS